jgi:hypothetical protein
LLLEAGQPVWVPAIGLLALWVNKMLKSRAGRSSMSLITAGAKMRWHGRPLLPG